MDSNNNTTFNQVWEALEIATRIEKLGKYIHQRKLDMTFREDAAHRIRVDEAEEFAALDRLSRILYTITEHSDENWKDTKYKDCVETLERYVL